MYVQTCHALGMSVVTLNFLGVTFRNIVCHGNFRKYDNDNDAKRSMEQGINAFLVCIYMSVFEDSHAVVTDFYIWWCGQTSTRPWYTCRRPLQWTSAVCRPMTPLPPLRCRGDHNCVYNETTACRIGYLYVYILSVMERQYTILARR